MIVRGLPDPHRIRPETVRRSERAIHPRGAPRASSEHIPAHDRVERRRLAPPTGALVLAHQDVERRSLEGRIEGTVTPQLCAQSMAESAERREVRRERERTEERDQSDDSNPQ